MNKITNIRYGSLAFIYLVTTAFIFNTTQLIQNPVSFAVFIVASVFKILFLNFADSHPIKIPTVAAILFGITIEFYCIINIFRYSSDNKSTEYGSYVFTLIIIAVIFIASKQGIYPLLKTANIIFFIPLVPLLVMSLYFVFHTPYTSEIFTDVNAYGIVASILDGTKCALLVFSDIYIIYIMQKNENCYNNSATRFFYLITVGIIATVNIMYRLIFGVNITNNLVSPIFSSLSVIGRLSLDEILFFIFSVCFLFRLCCKMAALKLLLETEKKTNLSGIICVILITIFALFGSALIYRKIIGINVVFNIAILLYFLSYTILPITRRLFNNFSKLQKPPSSTGFADKK